MPLTLRNFHYGRLDDPWYLAHREAPGGAVPTRIGPAFPRDAWLAMHDFLANALREQPVGMIDNDAGVVIPMHETEMWALARHAIPERDALWETEELLAFWQFPHTVEEDAGQWCLVWRRM